MMPKNYFHLDRLFSQKHHITHGINARSYNNFTYNHVEKSIQKIFNQTPGLIPKILDCGCGWGGLARALRKNFPNIVINGVEPDQGMAAVASLFHDNILTCSIDDFNSHKPIRDVLMSSDVIILSDVLEHIYDPWKVYSGICEILKPGSTLIISIPTLTNANSLAYLFQEGFAYRASGIYDFTHQRFFAPSDLLDLVSVLTRRPHTKLVTYNFCPESANMFFKSQLQDNLISCTLADDITLTVKKDSERHRQLITRGLIISINIE